MLKKVIATVTSLAMAALACASMTLSAFADNSVDTTANIEAEVETTTTAEVETSTEATTITTEATDAADVESTIREELNETPVKVRDIVYFEDGALLIDADGNTLRTGMGERFYIVDQNDVAQQYRVYLPKANRVLYLSYEDSVNAIIESHEGLVMGDVDCDGRIDSFDLVRMKKGLVYGWDDFYAYFMSDMNADGDVTMADLVLMERWLLGNI